MSPRPYPSFRTERGIPLVATMVGTPEIPRLRSMSRRNGRVQAVIAPSAKTSCIPGWGRRVTRSRRANRADFVTRRMSTNRLCGANREWQIARALAVAVGVSRIRLRGANREWQIARALAGLNNARGAWPTNSPSTCQPCGPTTNSPGTCQPLNNARGAWPTNSPGTCQPPSTCQPRGPMTKRGTKPHGTA